jgi:signal transduction histidine kinase
MVDLAVAVGFAAITEYEIWIGPLPFLEGSAHGFKEGFALGALLLSGALTVRRSRPLVASGLVGVAGLWAVLFLRLHPGTSANLFELFVAPLYMWYSTGANTTGRRTAIAAILMGIPLLLNQMLHPPPLNLQQDASEWLFYGALFLAGKTVQRLRTRSRNLTETRERDIEAAVGEERARIAREMHDVVAHGVSVMVLQAGAARQALDARPDRAREALVAAETTGRETLSELRRLLEILRPESGEDIHAPQPSLQDLDRLVEQLHAAGLPVVAEMHCDLTGVPKGLDAAAYRIVQEALTNAFKHARPSQVNVLINRDDARLHIEIRNDDALPKRLSARADGRGLIGMRERAQAYGGKLLATATPEGGFRVIAELPCSTA